MLVGPIPWASNNSCFLHSIIQHHNLFTQHASITFSWPRLGLAFQWNYAQCLEEEEVYFNLYSSSFNCLHFMFHFVLFELPCSGNENEALNCVPSAAFESVSWRICDTDWVRSRETSGWWLCEELLKYVCMTRNRIYNSNTPYSRHSHDEQKARLGKQMCASVHKSWRNSIFLSPSADLEGKLWRRE